MTEPEPPQGVWDRIKRFFGGDRIDRKRLAALGMGAVCSYGLISNITYGGGMAVGSTSRGLTMTCIPTCIRLPCAHCRAVWAGGMDCLREAKRGLSASGRTVASIPCFLCR